MCKLCMLSVSAKEYIELLEASGVDLDEKEIAKIDKMTSELGIIDKNDFLAYAKKSSVFKNLLEEEKHNFDKAELAFKVRKKFMLPYLQKNLFLCVAWCNKLNIQLRTYQVTTC